VIIRLGDQVDHRDHRALMCMGQWRNGDKDIPANDTSPTSTSSLPQQDSIPLAGPITRARAHQLNNQVSSLLSSYTPCLDCGDTCTICLLRNHGQERLGEGFGSAEFGLQHSTNF
jgi:hypothetical protein